LSVTVYNKRLSNQCNLPAQIEQVEDEKQCNNIRLKYKFGKTMQSTQKSCDTTSICERALPFPFTNSLYWITVLQSVHIQHQIKISNALLT